MGLRRTFVEAIAAKDGIVRIASFPEYCSAEHQRAPEKRAREIDLVTLGFEPGGPGMTAGNF